MKSRRQNGSRGARLWPLLLLIAAALMALLASRRCAAPPVAPGTTGGDPRSRAATAGSGSAPAKVGEARKRKEPRGKRPPADLPRAAPGPDVARANDRCGGVSAYGVCTGDVARACVAGQPVAIDCAAQDKRCVMTREGASCLQRRGAGLDCSHADAPRCEGDRLRHCVDGSWESLDCRMRLSRCDESGPRAQCAPASARASVFAAAASAARSAVERCDGHDNDHDSAIDEGSACDPIALVAFAPTGARLHDFEARRVRELEIVNRVFEPLVFTWSRVVPTQGAAHFHPRMFSALTRELARPSAISPSAQSADATHGSGSPLPAPLDFFIPVLFVERIATEPPKAGMSTLPNSRCGGVRISDRATAIEGLIVVSEDRQPETLAHEIGHYLGLCHTHEDLTGYGPQSDAALACATGGDGICDTAFDPGPPHCVELQSCEPYCEDVAARPATDNVMSYYMSCRRGLSPEQHAEAELNLSLRRGWFQCLVDQCACTPGARGQCPAEMSCQPEAATVTGAECLLDGPALPGAPCANATDCSLGAICIRATDGVVDARCARACTESDRECTCTDVGLSFAVCAEDLG